VEPTDHHLIPDAWTLVAFNASAALIIAPVGVRVWGQLAGDEAPPPISDFGGFAIRSMRIIQGIAPFEALWLRADAGPVTVTVYEGNTMSGVVYFGKSPFRPWASGPVSIEVPYVPQTLDGGGPHTDYTGLAVIDCGGPVTDPTSRRIDGRSAGETS
jgi:hypothetical protein